ncbi:MAG TPA: GAF domain-containing protein, partial [Xanthomonadales bacterium]|nr:GAF domain-containing protein [Xanthomonadales bacterium]
MNEDTAGTGRVGDRQLEVVMQIARIATADMELRAMLARIVDALRAALRWQFVAFASVDRANDRFVCEALSTELPSEIFVGYTRALGSGVVGQVALTGRAVVIDDVLKTVNYIETLPGVRSEICVPVVHRGEVIGVINAESVEPDAFRDQLPMLSLVADQLAGAIAGARLHRELGRRAALLEVMGEVAHTALAGERLAEVLDRIANYVQRRFGLESCAILLVPEDGTSLVATAGAGELPLHPRASWSIARGVVGRCYRTGMPQFVPDVTRDADYVMGNAAVAAEYAVPIRHHDRLLGVINMEAVDVETFDVDARAALIALANQVAGAIHLASVNGRLHQAIELVERQRTELAQANARLASANAELERLSLVDGLTGVANRRRFDAS